MAPPAAAIARWHEQRGTLVRLSEVLSVVPVAPRAHAPMRVPYGTVKMLPWMCRVFGVRVCDLVPRTVREVFACGVLCVNEHVWLAASQFCEDARDPLHNATTEKLRVLDLVLLSLSRRDRAEPWRRGVRGPEGKPFCRGPILCTLVAGPSGGGAVGAPQGLRALIHSHTE